MPVVSRMLAAAVALATLGAVPAHAAVRTTSPIAAADGLEAHPAAATKLHTTADAARTTADAADPRDDEAWHLDGDTAMGTRTAWDHTTGGDVIVAVVDSGIDLHHPDLAPNLWTNPGEIAGNRIDDDRDGLIDDVHGADVLSGDGDPQDDNGHGTHVAGIIGASGGNGIGASGVAWRVRLMAVKVLDATGSGNTLTVAAGIEWAVRHGARVINLSLAGAGRSQVLEDAIAEAQGAGVLIVVAAGNDHQDIGLLPSYPASYPEDNVLGIAATRSDGLLSTISSFGAGVDLAAPGEMIFSTALGGDYEYRTGTSMAAPMVSGAAALVLAMHPELDALGVSTALEQSARRTGLPVGAGSLDVGWALGGPVGTPPTVSPKPGSTTAPTGTGTAKAPTGAGTPPRHTTNVNAKQTARAKARMRARLRARAKAARAHAAKARAARARAAKIRAARALAESTA